MNYAAPITTGPDGNYFTPPATPDAAEVTPRHLEAAKSQILDDDNNLLDDFSEWESQIFEARTGQYVRMVRVVRDDNTTGFSQWREQHNAKSILELAQKIADNETAAINEAFHDECPQFFSPEIS